MPYDAIDLGQNKGNGLLSNGTKPLPEAMLTYHQQSGTKPNLVAKIWPPNLVTICAWLPRLVANVSSNFHHLVNTGLAVGSFFQMATNNSSPHLQIGHNLSDILHPGHFRELAGAHN